MTRLQRRRRTVIILICAIAAVAAAILAVLYWPQPGSGGEATPIINANPADIDSLSIEHGGETITFIKGESGEWSCAEQPDFPVGGSYIDSIVESFTAVTANREFTLEQSRGLNIGDETLHITAMAGDKSYELVFYSLNSQTLNYYARVNGGGVVYTVANTLADAFRVGLYDVAELENLNTVLGTELISLSVSIPGGNSLALYYRAGGMPEIDYSAASVWFYSLNGGSLRPADSIAASGVLDAFQNIANERLAAYNITPAQLEDYRLSREYIRAEMQYTPKGEEQPATVVRRFASYTAGDYSVSFTEGSGNVYYVDLSLVNSLIDAVNADLEPHNTLAIELGDITGFDVRYGSHSASYALERGADTDGNDVYSLYRDGEQVPSSDFVSLFFGLKAIVPQAVAESAGGEELFSITFYTTNQSFGGITLTLREYNDSFYASTIAGDSPLLLNRRTVDALLGYLHAL